MLYTTRRRMLSAVLSAAPLLMSARSARAQGFPHGRPIRLVAPSVPGGSADMTARLVSNLMAEKLGVSVVVENIVGAGGMVGMGQVARAKPDGHTLVIGFTTNVGTGPLLNKLPYDPVRDITPVGHVVAVNLCVATHPALPVQNIQELVALSKTRQGNHALMYGAWGLGSAAHLTMESLNVHTQAGMQMIPYKAEVEVTRALLANEIPVGAQTVNVFMSQQGRLKALGLAAPRRSAALPDVPTFTEQGVPFDLAAWLAIFAPAATPEPVLDVLYDALQYALAQPVLVERTRALGMDIVPMTRQAFAQKVPEEIAVWKSLMDAAGLKRAS